MKLVENRIKLPIKFKRSFEILRKIEDISGENVFACYQCGMCSAGCPMAPEMDILPNQVLRLLQIGAIEEVLETRTVWLCASCFTCSARCPKGVNLAKLMEGVRIVILREKNKDYFKPEEMIKEPLPAIALVSALRKFTT
ncbi:MAG TPA: heterodisulfide reductase [Candidatus Desulfofervidus auxilii]|uniref:Heterodisulfide reductase n=1 Tax=Desulfofervidus auxilii TaxID=1621989 RepID=A0A7C0Y8M4_DESA2|nr:4Fe-4S dicluster domain-containing protein [Candidatus Desulfofervidus auxilii]HDD43771.1 heterodisulfide reductase [Candidatus Desulfofervidus auxilii]